MISATLVSGNIATSGDTNGGEVTPTRRFFRLHDVLQIWGEERTRTHARAHGLDEERAVAAAQPIAESTYRSYFRESVDGRYARAGIPMPMPTFPDGGTGVRRGQHPLWLPEDGETIEGLERRIRAWWHARPGPGAGGGPPPKMGEEQARWARRRLAEPDTTVASVAAELGVTKSTLYRHLNRLDDARGDGREG